MAKILMSSGVDCKPLNAAKNVRKLTVTGKGPSFYSLF